MLVVVDVLVLFHGSWAAVPHCGRFFHGLGPYGFLRICRAKRVVAAV